MTSRLIERGSDKSVKFLNRRDAKTQRTFNGVFSAPPRLCGEEFTQT